MRRLDPHLNVGLALEHLFARLDRHRPAKLDRAVAVVADLAVIDDEGDARNAFDAGATERRRANA